MKKKLAYLLVPALCLGALAGCGEAQQTDSTADTKTGVMLCEKTDADFSKCADSLEKLVAHSDFIAELKVTAADAYVYPDSDIISTAITPEILTLYKGSYNGEQLHMSGGIISYQEYCSALVFQQEGIPQWDLSSQYSADELASARIYSDFCGNYVPQVGDTLLFFGVKDDQGGYYVTHDYQGLFRLDEGNWTNQALEIQADWQEPLATDLLTLSGAALTDTPAPNTYTFDEIRYEAPRSENTSALSIPQTALQNTIDTFTQTA